MFRFFVLLCWCSRAAPWNYIKLEEQKQIRNSFNYLHLQVPPALPAADPFNQRLPHSMDFIEVVHLQTPQNIRSVEEAWSSVIKGNAWIDTA